jgi:hypothetical protein
VKLQVTWAQANDYGRYVECQPRPYDAPQVVEMGDHHNEDVIRERLEELVENKYYPLEWEIVT